MGADDKEETFADLVGKVRPIRQDRVPLKPRAERPAPAPEPAPEPVDVVEEGGEPPIEFHRGGLQRQLLRKFRRGDIRFERSVDLHGHYREHARRMLLRFLGAAVDDGIRCVLVIHGRGSRSAQGRPVLRDLTRGVLQAHPSVLAFAPAQPRDGGVGASYVYLKTRSGGR